LDQWPWVGALTQQWQISGTGGSYNEIWNADSQKVMDDTNASLANGNLISEWGWVAGLNQQWEIVPVQNTYQMTGQTNIYYSSTYNQVVATGTTDQDYNTSYYYGNKINTQVTDNGVLVAQSTWGFNSGQTGFGSTLAVISTPKAGHTFQGYSVFQLTETYLEYQVISNCGAYCNYWYDPFNYTFVASNPEGTDDPTFATTVWAAPIVIAVASPSKVISTGNNASTVSVPGARDYFDLKFRSFIPAAWVYGAGYPIDYCIDASGNKHKPIYAGDHRNFDPFSKNYRSFQEVAVSASAGKATTMPFYGAGTTVRYSDDALASDRYSLIGDGVLNDCHLTDQVKPGSISGNTAISGGGGTIQANLYGSATNMATTWGPYATPSINWNVTYSINAVSNPSYPAYTFSYTHDCFPAYEAYIGTQQIYGFKPSNYSASTIGYCLAGGSPVQSATIGTVN
jgi:hypothetical protein